MVSMSDEVTTTLMELKVAGAVWAMASREKKRRTRSMMFIWDRTASSGRVILILTVAYLET
ncbi:MAG: hypothetical protein KA369_03360 [Spirochaetes bacterium]|nr:hypothetical protein [Spirochaetota bacterium]